CGRKELVGDTHFCVVGRARERRDRFGLGFPAKASDRSVITAAVRMTGNAQSRALRRRSVMAAQNLPVLDRVDQPEPQELQRNAKRQIPGWFGCKIGLYNFAVWDCRIIVDPRDNPERMHTSVPRPVGVPLEADLPYRAELLFKGRDDVLFAEAVWNQPEHRVFRKHRLRLAGLGAEEAAGPAESGLGMTHEALVAVVPCPEAVRIGVELREDGVEFAQASHRRAICHIRAAVAGRFQLSGPQYPLF